MLPRDRMGGKDLDQAHFSLPKWVICKLRLWKRHYWGFKTLARHRNSVSFADKWIKKHCQRDGPNTADGYISRNISGKCAVTARWSSSDSPLFLPPSPLFPLPLFLLLSCPITLSLYVYFNMLIVVSESCFTTSGFKQFHININDPVQPRQIRFLIYFFPLWNLRWS